MSKGFTRQSGNCLFVSLRKHEMMISKDYAFMKVNSDKLSQ